MVNCVILSYVFSSFSQGGSPGLFICSWYVVEFHKKDDRAVDNLLALCNNSSPFKQSSKHTENTINGNIKILFFSPYTGAKSRLY